MCSDKTKDRIPMYYDTHWMLKFKSIRYFKQNFETILLTLQESRVLKKCKT